MANWSDILEEINGGSNYDLVRRKYLKQLATYTKRNVITYYSGWLQKQNFPNETSINDSDKNGFMSAIKGLDTSKGLDLILHTPGGDTAATESIIYYLKAKFTDIRVFVPQLAMSAGTIIACASNEIWMGEHSSLGPIDPQLGGTSAHGILEEFNRAFKEIQVDQLKMAVWQPILNKYPPNFLGDCQKAIDWSNKLLEDCLTDRMFAGLSATERNGRIVKIKEELGDHSINYAHNRHLSPKKCREIKLEVKRLEDDQRLQDLILSVHHASIQTLTATPAIKIVENHKGTAFIQSIQPVLALMK
jgi:ClpP class serine protease